MLRSIQLENFKPFGRRTIIPLAPITLVFGENSAGKSSILQALNLLKQTRESREVEALLLPRSENGIVDLGSFQELLFDHDLERALTIRLDVAFEGGTASRFYRPPCLRNLSTLGLECLFSRKSINDEISLIELRLCGANQASHIASFLQSPMPPWFRRSMPFSFRSGRRRQSKMFRAARCSSIRDERDFWMPPFVWTINEKTNILKSLEAIRQAIESGELPEVKGAGDEDERGYNLPEFLTRVQEAISFVSSDFTYDQYVFWMMTAQANTYVALDGFIPVYAGQETSQSSLDALVARSSFRLINRRDWMPDIGFASVLAGRAVDEALSSLFPLGPFRKPPSRWYIFTGTTPQDVGYQGHLLPDLLFREPDLLANTNAWLKSLGIGYEIAIRSLGGVSSDLFEVRLVDKRRQPPVEVGLSDVGFGISQILPLIVQSLAASRQIITIEQPEVHIHPRLQADLGDLLIEAIKEPRQNQFIIETHSEHLALRLQRRVREKALSPSDISVLFVGRGPEGATVQALRIDDDGDFIDDFPGGFFPERLRELR
jgi:AAA ATPase domain